MLAERDIRRVCSRESGNLAARPFDPRARAFVIPVPLAGMSRDYATNLPEVRKIDRGNAD
jgi:hypothetical protein